MAAHVNHQALGLPPALDMGALDGRNAFQWRVGPDTYSAGPAGDTAGIAQTELGLAPAGMQFPSHGLYVGSIASRVVVPWALDFDTLAVDYLPPERSPDHVAAVAVLEHWSGGTGAVAVYDDAGRRRLLTTLNLVGDESVRFSPDGQWLLVSGTSDAHVVDVATGRWAALPVGNCDWWPRGFGCVLAVEAPDRSEGLGALTTVPRVYDLVRGEYVAEFRPIHITTPGSASSQEFCNLGGKGNSPNATHMLAQATGVAAHAWFPVVDRNGQRVLVQSRVGINDEYQTAHGSRSRVAQVDLATGVGQLLHGGVWLDEDHHLERDQMQARWVTKGPDQVPARWARWASQAMPGTKGIDALAALDFQQPVTEPSQETDHLISTLLHYLKFTAAAADKHARARIDVRKVLGQSAAVTAEKSPVRRPMAAQDVCLLPEVGAAVDALARVLAAEQTTEWDGVRNLLQRSAASACEALRHPASDGVDDRPTAHAWAMLWHTVERTRVHRQSWDPTDTQTIGEDLRDRVWYPAP